MTDHHVDALVTQPLHHIAFGNVCALNLVAQIMHHLRNAGHANAANANEVNGADVNRNALHAGTPCMPMRGLGDRTRCGSFMNGAEPMLSRRSARSSAALGQPQIFARFAAFSLAPGLSDSLCISLTNSKGVKYIR